jgi:hypothetical protein
MSTITDPPPASGLGVWAPPAPVERPAPPRPNGAAAATLLACGIGCAFFGLVVVFAEANPWLHHALEFSRAVGPLSGKSTVGLAGWLATWAVLHHRLRGREVAMAPVVRATRILVAVGFLLTFPPVFMFFAAG